MQNTKIQLRSNEVPIDGNTFAT